MTAAGKEEQIKKAKDTLVKAVIGLIIILTAYAVTNFVVDVIINADDTAGYGVSPGNGQQGDTGIEGAN